MIKLILKKVIKKVIKIKKINNNKMWIIIKYNKINLIIIRKINRINMNNNKTNNKAYYNIHLDCRILNISNNNKLGITYYKMINQY